MRKISSEARKASPDLIKPQSGPEGERTFRPEPIKLVLTIVDRGRGQDAAALYRDYGVTFSLIAPSRGAAGSEVADVLGLTSVERDIVLSVVRAESVPAVLSAAQSYFHFNRPGTGVVASVSIAGVSGPKVLGYISGVAPGTAPGTARGRKSGVKAEGKFCVKAEEESSMSISGDYDLIVTVVNRGFADQVVDAAKEGGAGGGTIFYARGSGIHEVEKFFSVSIQPEREVVLSLVHHGMTRQVMHAIIAAAGLMTEGKGLAFSLPVDQVMGVVHEEKFHQENGGIDFCPGVEYNKKLTTE